MECCTNTYNLGCFDSCDTIILPFAYEQNGTHRFQFETQFRFKFTQTGIALEDIEIDLSKLPENQTIDLKIFNPNGTPYTYTVGEIEYDCFRLKTDIYKDLDDVISSGTISTPCCKPKIYALSGVFTKTFTYQDWSSFGAIPSFEVYYKDDGAYITIPVQPIYDTMPNPTTITITISGIPTDVWYIKMSN